MDEATLDPVVERLDRIARLLERAVAAVAAHGSHLPSTAPTPALADLTSEPLWDARRTAEFLRCSISKVYKAAEANRLPCLRDGRSLRFKPSEIRGYVDKLRGTPGAIVRIR